MSKKSTKLITHHTLNIRKNRLILSIFTKRRHFRPNPEDVDGFFVRVFVRFYIWTSHARIGEQTRALTHSSYWFRGAVCFSHPFYRYVYARRRPPYSQPWLGHLCYPPKPPLIGRIFVVNTWAAYARQSNELNAHQIRMNTKQLRMWINAHIIIIW